MDTSKEYIEMCDYNQIQVLRPPDADYCNHDFFACSECGEVAKEDVGYYFTYCSHKSELIWLPRQDQLHEMFAKGTIWGNSLKFEYFLRGDDGHYDIKQYAYQFTSMEQLWLAFVMKEKYNKLWSGTEWQENQR